MLRTEVTALIVELSACVALLVKNSVFLIFTSAFVVWITALTVVTLVKLLFQMSDPG
jgi:hypothetical protein